MRKKIYWSMVGFMLFTLLGIARAQDFEGGISKLEPGRGLSIFSTQEFEPMDVQTSSPGPAKVVPLQVLTLNENSEIQPAFCTYGYADHDTCVMLTHFYVKKPGNLSLKLLVIEPNGDRSVWNLGKAYVDQGLYYAWAEGWFGMPGNHRMKWVYKTGTLIKKVGGKFIVFECVRP